MMEIQKFRDIEKKYQSMEDLDPIEEFVFEAGYCESSDEQEQWYEGLKKALDFHTQQLTKENEELKNKEKWVWKYLCEEEKKLEGLVSSEKLFGNVVKEASYKGELTMVRAVMINIKNYNPTDNKGGEIE